MQTSHKCTKWPSEMIWNSPKSRRKNAERFTELVHSDTARSEFPQPEILWDVSLFKHRWLCLGHSWPSPARGIPVPEASGRPAPCTGLQARRSPEGILHRTFLNSAAVRTVSIGLPGLCSVRSHYWYYSQTLKMMDYVVQKYKIGLGTWL